MRLHRLLTKGQLYDIEIMHDAIRSNIGDITFQAGDNMQVKSKYHSDIWLIGSFQSNTVDIEHHCQFIYYL